MLNKAIAAKDFQIESSDNKLTSLTERIDQLTKRFEQERNTLEAANRRLTEELQNEKAERSLVQGALEIARESRVKIQKKYIALRKKTRLDAYANTVRKLGNVGTHAARVTLKELRGVILPLRAPRSARNYRRVWMDDGSPLAVYSRRLHGALEMELEAQRPGAVALESAFLYSEPQLRAALQRLRAAGASRIVVLPLFPQCSGTTTGAVYDQVGAELGEWRSLPDVSLIGDYHDHPDYIAALANSVREHWLQHGRTAQLLMSFHGIPQRCVQRGDPYEQHCRQTASLLAAALELGASDWSLSFQSRFGSVVMDEEHLTAAFRHVLRNALLPMVTLIGLQAGTMLGGSVVVSCGRVSPRKNPSCWAREVARRAAGPGCWTTCPVSRRWSW